MKHLGTKRLETARLALRRYSVDDTDAMYANWASDPEVTKYLMWPHHETVETSRRVLADWIGHYGEEDYYHWAIVLKENGDRPIGDIAVVRRDDTVEMVHIGYCIGRKWWNRGITTGALREVIRFFFEEVDANRVEARHDPRNVNSGKVMARCGMRYEGTQRQADRNNQGRCDSAMYAILAEEYARDTPH